MAVQRLSKRFNVAKAKLAEMNVFDCLVGMDSHLHVDPHLLSASKVPEMQLAAVTFDQYWTKLYQIISSIKDDGDRLSRQAVGMLRFKEFPAAGLGFSKGGREGSGVGAKLAKHLLSSARQIIELGVNDPSFFELIGLFEVGIATDRLSDVTIRIAAQHFLEYSSRVSSQLSIPTKPFSYLGKKYLIPFDRKSKLHILLFPMDVLRSMPTAFDWSDVSYVSAYNDGIRRRVNSLIGGNWEEARKKKRKEEVREAILSDPKVLKELIALYKSKPKTPYDFTRDELGELLDLDAIVDAVNKSGLDRNLKNQPTLDGAINKTLDVFEQMIVNNGLWRLLYTDDRKPKHERAAQLTFFCIAKLICDPLNIDVSPETNAGNGPIDFKFSRGSEERALIELKLSTNSRLRHGFETQIEKYAAAEQTVSNWFLIVKVHPGEIQINEVLEMQANRIKTGHKTAHVKVVDGQWKQSASKSS